MIDLWNDGSKIILGKDGANVGVNNDNPTEKLDVIGNIKATNFIGDGFKTPTGTGAILLDNGTVDESNYSQIVVDSNGLDQTNANLNTTYPIADYPIGTIRYSDEGVGAEALYLRKSATEWIEFYSKSTVNLLYQRKIKSYTFSSLPLSPETNSTASITDAGTVTYRGIASGGGTDFALVVFDGTNWIYH